MLAVALRCERYEPYRMADGNHRCDIPEIVWHPDETPITLQDINDQLMAADYVTVDGKHYCRRHNPHAVGVAWEIHFDPLAYHEIPGTGYELRYVHDRTFELRRTPTEPTEE